MDSDAEKAEELLRASIKSFGRAADHSDPQRAAEAYYNRSKSHWRLGRLTNDAHQMQDALRDADEAAKRFYDHKSCPGANF
jgi:hypothetical protein